MEVRECLLPFGAESFVFQFAIQNVKNMYRSIILLVVLYVCETWSLTLREERRLRVFENRVLRRIFGPEKDEITRLWRKVHNGELNILYSPNVVQVIKIENEIGGARSTYGGRGEAYTRFWWGGLRVMRPLGRSRRRWEGGSSGSGLWGHGQDRAGSG